MYVDRISGRLMYDLHHHHHHHHHHHQQQQQQKQQKQLIKAVKNSS